MDAAAPADLRTNLRRFDTTDRAHLFIADGSRIYDLPDALAASLDRVLAGEGDQHDRAASAQLLDDLLGEVMPRRIDTQPIAPPPIHSLSLNVAQACNMSCGYCYADAGAFGGTRRMMSTETARAAVDRLVSESAPGSDVVLGFMGGEPLLNRSVLHDAAWYAAETARRSGRTIRFSITTNGTLLTSEDAALFAALPFTVTMSVDGPPAVHNRLRLLNAGGDAYARLCQGLELFAQHGRPRSLSARVTVTPSTGPLVPVLDHVLSMGFDEVGFAPVLVSPDPALAFSVDHMAGFLDEMIACGTKTLDRLLTHQRYPFANFEYAMRELHRGTHRPYPCGAGAAYLSVNAEGDLYACHRLIDDAAFKMGDIHDGPDHDRRATHLQVRHVDREEPCKSCWARYLCGGGCYHEVTRRGRHTCDYIRGWLAFCLSAYVQLTDRCPEYFDGR